MEFYYEVLKAHITPEALGQLNEHKIIFESASQQKLKQILYRSIRLLWHRQIK